MPIRPVIVAVAVASLAALFPGACVAKRLQRAPSTSASVETYDVVVRNGRVMDPESSLDAIRSIGISAGVISIISTEPLAGRVVIDAGGLVVAPGFIDTDGFAENAQLQVRDGVTTVFDLRLGTADVDRWYSEREGKVLINFGVSIGYLAVRSEVMGGTGGLDRKGTKPSEAQLAEILRKVERGFDEGAVALGMGSSGGPDPTGSDQEIQEIQEIQPMDADERLTRESAARYHDRDFEAFVHNDSIEPFVVEAITSPFVSFASHGSGSSWTGRGRGHPRTSGTFSRVLGHYVREQRVLSLMEALRKMSLMPAQRLTARVPAMRNKGRVRVGADADIVVFDADRIIDRATFQQQRPSEGVRYVLVNGVLVIRDGDVQEGVYAGRAVRAPLQGHIE